MDRQRDQEVRSVQLEEEEAVLCREDRSLIVGVIALRVVVVIDVRAAVEAEVPLVEMEVRDEVEVGRLRPYAIRMVRMGRGRGEMQSRWFKNGCT